MGKFQSATDECDLCGLPVVFDAETECYEAERGFDCQVGGQFGHETEA